MLTARATGFPDLRSMVATSSSAAVTPLRTSTTMMMASASSIPISAWRRINRSISLSLLGSMPPVSTREKVRPHHSQSP